MVLGYVLIAAIAGLYLVDIFTNYAAFTGGELIPQGVDGGIRSLIAVVFSLGLTFGDELLHLLADENSVGAAENQATYSEQTSNLAARKSYHTRKSQLAAKTAIELGKQHGEQWRP